MTTDELTGRALDIAIAERVMGWRWVEHAPHTRTLPGYTEAVRWLAAPDEPDDPLFRIPANSATPIAEDADAGIPPFSTDIAAAWLVIEKMHERGYWCEMRTPFERDNANDYWAGFTPHSTTGWNGRPDHCARAETMPLAICKAALAAVGED